MKAIFMWNQNECDFIAASGNSCGRVDFWLFHSTAVTSSSWQLSRFIPLQFQIKVKFHCAALCHALAHIIWNVCTVQSTSIWPSVMSYRFMLKFNAILFTCLIPLMLTWMWRAFYGKSTWLIAVYTIYMHGVTKWCVCVRSFHVCDKRETMQNTKCN